MVAREQPVSPAALTILWFLHFSPPKKKRMCRGVWMRGKRSPSSVWGSLWRDFKGNPILLGRNPPFVWGKDIGEQTSQFIGRCLKIRAISRAVGICSSTKPPLCDCTSRGRALVTPEQCLSPALPLPAVPKGSNTPGSTTCSCWLPHSQGGSVHFLGVLRDCKAGAMESSRAKEVSVAGHYVDIQFGEVF